MRRRSRAGGEPPQAQRRRAVARRPSITTKAMHSSQFIGCPPRETKVARLTRERDEALARQNATSEILRVISQSPTDVKLVFDSIVLTAARLLRSDLVLVLLCDGATYSHAAVASPDGPFEDLGPTNFPIDPSANFPSRAIVDKKMLHLPDWSLIDLPEHEQKIRKKFGTNSALYLPLLRDGECIGLLTLVGKRPNTFGAAEIAQAQSFRDQALIAIENTRLFEAEQQRTRELSKSLEQQTATSDVLRVISSSPSDIQPVLETIGERAGKLCNAELSAVSIVDGELIRLASIHGMTEAEVEAARRAFPVRRTDETVHARAIRTRSVCQVADVLRDPQYQLKDTARVSGYRGCLGVPMVRGEQAVGAIVLARREPGLFSVAQVQLLKTFADQAVIAIENVRLFKETKNSLEQQTATADVLKVISRSTFDLPTVLRTLAESAARLCVADKGIIVLVDGDVYRLVANYGFSPEALRYAAEHPVRRDHDTLTGRVALEGRAIQIRDVLADPEYRATGYQQAFGYRTALAVPLLREEATIGVFFLSRDEVNPFNERQIELVTTSPTKPSSPSRMRGCSTNCVIAPTADRYCRRAQGHQSVDLRFADSAANALGMAARFCEADKASIVRDKDGAFYATEAYGFSDEFLDYMKNVPIKAERGLASGRALVEGKVVHIADVAADPEYTLAEGARLGDYRTILCVPMLREGVPIGLLVLTRSEVQAFTDEQIELVTTFADQAAIAIENVRLFEAEQQRTRELANSLEDLRTAQDRLVQTQKLASLGQLTAGIAHEIKNPLNFVNNFSGVSGEMLGELREALNRVKVDDKTRAEITELADTLRDNLHKIVQHGKRADAIVKNMLLHSREGSGEHRPVDINGLVEESRQFRLSWRARREAGVQYQYGALI